MGLLADIHKDLEVGALRLLVEYRARLHDAAVKLCDDETQADDLVFRTIERVLAKPDSYKVDTNLFGWMLSIMENIHLNDIKRPVVRGTVAVDDATMEEYAGADWSTDEQILKNSDCEAVRAALRDIPPEYKQTVILRFYEDLSLKEIASILNKPVGTVGRRIHVALHLLAGKLRAEFGKAKKPLAVLLAALLGVGALFGAWQTGLLAPFLSQRGEAYPPSEASCEAGAMRGESFPLQEETETIPLQEETVQSGAEPQSEEAESFPLQEGTVLPPEESQSETTKEQPMNMKTVKAVAASAVVAASAAVANATTITVKNFDEDLATVYVNDVPTTNGQQVVVDGSVKIELKDFRDDYYFRFAPETQTDRSLALGSWEGVPEGYKGENPATFDVTGDLMITPNVNVKGYKWVAASDGKTAESAYFKWNVSSRKDDLRTVVLGACVANLVGSTEPSLPLDCVQRVEYNGKNYTITSFANTGGLLTGSYIDRIALPHKFSFIGQWFANGSNFKITAFPGIEECSITTVDHNAFEPNTAEFNGPATNFVPRSVVTTGQGAYKSRRGMTDEVDLPNIKTLGIETFQSCSGLTSARLVSPVLATIGQNAFAGCSSLTNVTMDASHLTSVNASAFPSTLKRFVFVGAAPAQGTVDNIVGQQTAADGAHALQMQIDPTEPSWWALTDSPTANELAARPDGCLGVYVTTDGKRKAWVVADAEAAGGTLLETDMTKVGNAGYVTHGGLKQGDPLVLTAPTGMTKCELQHLDSSTGRWTTSAVKVGESIPYTHDGELTRVVWRVDGVALSVVVAEGYAGSVSVELKSGEQLLDGVYSNNAEVWIRAIGSSGHPRSALEKWTGDVPAGEETTDVLKLTLTQDTELSAVFRPLEWVYDPGTKEISDGYYLSTARTGDIVDYGMTFAGFSAADYTPWLDFSLPIYNPEDEEHVYWITTLTSGRTHSAAWRRVRFGANIRLFTDGMFYTSQVLEEVEGFELTQITSIPANFFHIYEQSPLYKSGVQAEAEDYIPDTLTEINSGSYQRAPAFKGTLRLRLPDLSQLGNMRIGSVTNLEFLAEDLTSFPSFASVTSPNRAIFASTNLASAVQGALRAGLKELVFLAHAPARTALDNLLFNQATCTTIISCSKYAPGWRELRMKGYTSCPEWNARPEDCWGVYQTADGKKRYYLVQKDSKYDVRKGFAVLVK